MIPAAPQVGDTVVILAAPFETGRVAHVETETTPVVDVLVPAGHVVRVKADEVRVVVQTPGLPEPTCPAWCDRKHGGFEAETRDEFAVLHEATRGQFSVAAYEYLDADGSRETSTMTFYGPDEDRDADAGAPTVLAMFLRLSLLTRDLGKLQLVLAEAI